MAGAARNSQVPAKATPPLAETLGSSTGGGSAPGEDHFRPLDLDLKAFESFGEVGFPGEGAARGTCWKIHESARIHLPFSKSYQALSLFTGPALGDVERFLFLPPGLGVEGRVPGAAFRLPRDPRDPLDPLEFHDDF